MRGPAPHEVPQPRVLVLGTEIPITSVWENQWALCLSETEDLWSPRYSF